MLSHSTIRAASIKPKRRKGEGPVTYLQRTRYLQKVAELTAYKASLLVEREVRNG